MKRILLLFLLLIFFSQLKAGNEEEIKQVVRAWNDLHNGKDGGAFVNVFAREILFYGRTINREQCCKLKTKLLNAGFHQDIISDIELTFYKSGTVKCDFSKRTKAKNVIREHAAYLLLQQLDGQYKITGESDLNIDQVKNITLNLGEEDKGKLASEIWIAGFVLLVLVCIIAWYPKRKPSDNETLYIPSRANRSMNTGSFSAETDHAKLIGNAFEKFVVKKFDPQYFKLLEWRSDKYHEGIYATSNQMPDMEWSFKNAGYEPAVFAVECKYRSSTNAGYIQIAKDYQLKNYRTYQQEKQIPVFIVLGLGGTAPQPAELFIIPLEKLTAAFVNIHLFKKKRTNQNFFYNSVTRELS